MRYLFIIILISFAGFSQTNETVINQAAQAVQSQNITTRSQAIDALKANGMTETQARQLAMFFAKKYTKASLASIGSQIGKRDHATVLHACKTVDNLSSTDKQFRKFVEDLGKKLSV